MASILQHQVIRLFNIFKCPRNIRTEIVDWFWKRKQVLSKKKYGWAKNQTNFLYDINENERGTIMTANVEIMEKITKQVIGYHRSHRQNQESNIQDYPVKTHRGHRNSHLLCCLKMSLTATIKLNLLQLCSSSK